jgi:predicted deacetylase
MINRDVKIIIIAVLIGIAFLFIFLYFSRHFSSKELDDVTPGISCEKDLIEKSDVLWIIPIFENESIAGNEEWCSGILALNKTLGLHGVYHTYNEFGFERNEDYLNVGIRAFEDCFGFRPKIFKAPQLKLSSENKALLEEERFEVKNKFNQLTHKVCHCEDTGMFSNNIIDIF